MALKKTVTEEFDGEGRLTKRVTVEEEDGQSLQLAPVYPYLPMYPYVPPVVIPAPWQQPEHHPPTITWIGPTCGNIGSADSIGVAFNVTNGTAVQ